MLLQALLTGMPHPWEDPADCQGVCHMQAGTGWPPHLPQLHFSLCPVPPYLATVYDAPVGVDALQAAMGVQLRRLVGTPQAEALAPAQQNVEVVMEVVVQPAGGACSREQPFQERALSLQRDAAC